MHSGPDPGVGGGAIGGGTVIRDAGKGERGWGCRREERTPIQCDLQINNEYLCSIRMTQIVHEYTHTKKTLFIVYLKFKFNWTSRVVCFSKFGNPKRGGGPGAAPEL